MVHTSPFQMSYIARGQWEWKWLRNGIVFRVGHEVHVMSKIACAALIECGENEQQQQKKRSKIQGILHIVVLCMFRTDTE